MLNRLIKIFAALAFLSVALPVWAQGWQVHPGPIFSGQYAAVGDPSVIKAEDGSYLMFHHCIDVLRDPQGGEICLATSPDGLKWSFAKTAESVRLVKSRLLRARLGRWDEAHETPFAIRVAGAIRLYVLGYRGSSVFSDQSSARIGMLESPDPLSFPSMGRPMFGPSVPEDAGGITSPSVVRTGKGMVLYYTGWSCSLVEPACAAKESLRLMAVPLDSAGRPSGRPRVVMADPGPAWAQGGTSESSVVRGPDGRFYLFFSSIAGQDVQRIGMAVSEGAFGPFTALPDPIIQAEDVVGSWANGGVLAPDVMIERGRVRLWFHAFETDAAGQVIKARIGYAEHAWPLLP